MAKQAKGTTKKPNVVKRFVGYVGDVRGELKRVVWPPRHEVLNMSMVVITTLIFFIFFTFIVDRISLWFVALIARLGG